VSEGWTENSNGNWLLIDGGEHEATVYKTDFEWRTVWNGARDGKARRLKAKHLTAEEQMTATEAAIAEGANSIKWWPPDDRWQTTKKGDGYYRRLSGATISVKRTRRGSWCVTNGSASLGSFGRTSWFASDAEARSAFDAFTRGEGGWHWVARDEAA
jgi:hypothetical protein